MLPDLPYEQLVATVDAVVQELFDTAGVNSPPVDSLTLARTLEIDVARDDRQRSRARFVRLAGRNGGRSRASILVRDEPRSERRQWAIAHELGEWSAARLFANWGTTARDAPFAAREAVANLFAARLLLPDKWFTVAAEACDMDLAALKESFATASYELIARRTLDLAPPAVVTVFDQGGITWRRSNALQDPLGLTAPEREIWRAAHESACFTEGVSPLGRCRCWPVHEAEWRREIARLDLVTEL